MRQYSTQAVLAMIAGMFLWVTPLAPAKAAEIHGFRSALFGTDQETALLAASKDLGIDAKSFVRKSDPVTRVTVLSAGVPLFAPLDLPATVNYVFGYRCDCLTQVSIQWRYPKDTNIERRGELIQAIAALVRHFQAQEWDESEVTRILGKLEAGRDAPLAFFFGRKKRGESVLLLGSPTKVRKIKDEQFEANVDDIDNVTLIYERNSRKPDIYTIQVDGF